MKNLLGISAAVLGMLVLASPSHGQILAPIAWGSATNMTGDTDVANNDSPFDAVTLHGSADTVNTVTFNSIASSLTDGTITFVPNNGTTGSATFPTAPPSSVNYSNLVSAIAFGYQSNSSVILANLTINTTYQVEVFSWYQSGFTNGVTTLTGATPVNLDPSIGQFAVGTFTASATSEQFGFDSQGLGTYDIIDAVSVEQVAATPEPASAWLILAGFAGLGVYLRRKRSIQA